MRRFLQSYRDILVYHDYGPLLLFWNVADLANNEQIIDMMSELAALKVEVKFLKQENEMLKFRIEAMR